MAILHLSTLPTESHYQQVINDSRASISLLPENMKAYYQLAQAQIGLHFTAEALESAKEAHRLCVEECRKVPIGKGSSSIGPITELVLRCKKEWWEALEEKRLKERGGLLQELKKLLETERQAEIDADAAFDKPVRTTLEGDLQEVHRRYNRKIEELERTFEVAALNGVEGKRRKVPDWAIDDITFSVMLDPVVVRSSYFLLRAS